ncbi:MAG: diacylglycerol kinase family protein [Clostridia bacterium]|nr:diacylglycerol kinase family protein [Clostridia bacterium]
MAKTVVLYNPLSGNCTAQTVERMFSDAIRYDVTQISDYAALLNDLTEEDALILCGGDGTLNRFANEIYEMDVKCDILYLPVGTGNDFAFDVIGSKCSEAPIPVKQYLKSLPTVTVNGTSYRFLNGVGFGIDGYCCEVGDELRKKSDKSINYAMIAIKGLLFHYKPTNAKITVDGTEYCYKKVWLAPAMFGRFYGGGMMPTPGQTRDSDTVSTLVFYGSGKLKTLMIFPSIFSGKHVAHKNAVAVLTGREISVEFDSPRALQIDGETILGVTSYKAVAPQRAE